MGGLASEGSPRWRHATPRGNAAGGTSVRCFGVSRVRSISRSRSPRAGRSEETRDRLRIVGIGIVTASPTAVMASRAVVRGVGDERAGATTKEEADEEDARVGGEELAPGLVDELYESLRDAVRWTDSSVDSVVG
jgi:hypothetical protein